MAVYDAHANLAISTVATAPSPATSGTSLVVGSGEGSRFPTAPFNATLWPANTRPDPSNAEIVRVTAISTDTFTITRAQEGTSAKTVTTSFLIAATVTAKTVTDLETNTEYAFSNWGLVQNRQSALNFALTSGATQFTDLLLYPNSTVALAAAGSAVAAFRIDPADYTGGSGRTVQIRIVGWVITNAVAPGITFTFNLKPVATWGGASNVDPTVATIGAATVTSTITTPSASTQTETASSAATFPTAGWYVVTFSTSGTNATNAISRWGWRLEYRRA